MQKAANIFLVLTVLACMSALVVSIYPGVLNDVLFLGGLLTCTVGPIAGLVGLYVIGLLRDKGRFANVRIPWKPLVVAFVCLFLTYATLKFYIPRRVVFSVTRPAFEAHIDQAVVSDFGGAEFDGWIGPYKVDEFAADPRGGVFFRVYSGRDGIGPDTMSYGFAFEPNPEGTPFGAAHYRTFRLGNSWCWFRASDDWH